MNLLPANIYHVYNQGNNRQQVFFTRQDYLLFLRLYKRCLFPNVSTIAWCLMPNHFHFMIHTDERCGIKIKQGGIFIDPVTNGIRKLLSGYARIFNSRNERSGSLFRQKTKAEHLADLTLAPAGIRYESCINCFNYIHLNPLAAKLVSRLEDWEFSSFIDYAGLRCGMLCRKELAALYCGYNPDNFICRSYELINEKLFKI